MRQTGFPDKLVNVWVGHKSIARCGKITLCAALLVFLGGCSVITPESWIGRTLGMNTGVVPEGKGCPQVAMIRDLSVTKNIQDGNMLSRAAITETRSYCSYDENSDIRVPMEIDFLAERGKAFKGDTASYQYFVAVVGPRQNIVNKEVFTADVKFDEDEQKATLTEKLEPHIHSDKEIDGISYQVLVGFQLNQEEIGRVRGEKNTK